MYIVIYVSLCKTFVYFCYWIIDYTLYNNIIYHTPGQHVPKGKMGESNRGIRNSREDMDLRSFKCIQAIPTLATVSWDVSKCVLNR